MDWLATWAPDLGARRLWALGELLEAAGVPAFVVDAPEAAGEHPMLVLGQADPGRPACSIPVDADAGLEALLGSLRGAGDPASFGDRFPFDAVGLLASLLTDAPEGRGAPGAPVAPPDVDAHGRLRYAASLPARLGVGDLAIVDRVVALVGRWLEVRLGVERAERWPGGARTAVVLSHDVDHPDRYGILRAVARDPRRLRTAPRTILSRTLQEARGRLRDPAPDEFWAFDALVASEGRRGFTSTYLFSAMPFYGTWGSNFDVAYDVTAPRFQPVFEHLRATGNEIGLHTGYAAHAAPGRIAAERQRLERVAGVDIRGNRHHYWQLGPNPPATLREHESAGFAWDASLAFNDHPGFRRSTSLPFHPWDEASGAPLRLLEIPTGCMDGSLLYSGGDADSAIAAADALLAGLEVDGGALVLDWHLQASVPTNREYRVWADAYQGILDVVAARSGTWVTSLGDLERWWTERGARLRAGPRV